MKTPQDHDGIWIKASKMPESRAEIAELRQRLAPRGPSQGDTAAGTILRLRRRRRPLSVEAAVA
jgi:hypothetical protein